MLYGDMIASITGIGRAWIGLILMATITSLPELMVYQFIGHCTVGRPGRGRCDGELRF